MHSKLVQNPAEISKIIGMVDNKKLISHEPKAFAD